MELIDFITVMPPENASEERGHKLPFIASEILNMENNLIQKFFTSQDSKPDHNEADTIETKL